MPKPRHPCPCCGFLTLLDPSGFEICPVCYWEDDGQGEADADDVRGGPNGILSLTEAKTNFAKYGASDPKFRSHVRPAKPDELIR